MKADRVLDYLIVLYVYFVETCPENSHCVENKTSKFLFLSFYQVQLQQ